MAWEQRGGSLYYYRKRRQGRRVLSEYVGSGLAGRMASALDNDEQERRRSDREKLDQQMAEVERLDQALRRLNSSIGTIVYAMLFASGFHCHKGQWRKRRNG